MPFRFFPAWQTGPWRFEVPGAFRLGGLDIRRPASPAAAQAARQGSGRSGSARTALSPGTRSRGARARFEVPGAFRLGGLDIRRPAACRYLDGI
jgi:hypothetical protein